MQNIPFLENYPKMTKISGESVAPLELKEHYSGGKKNIPPESVEKLAWGWMLVEIDTCLFPLQSVFIRGLGPTLKLHSISFSNNQWAFWSH